MSSRGDALARELDSALEFLQTRLNEDGPGTDGDLIQLQGCVLNEVKLALMKYRSSAPGPETHREVAMEIRLDEETLIADEPGRSPDPNLPVVAVLRFHLPRPQPAPEIDDVEVEA